MFEDILVLTIQKVNTRFYNKKRKYLLLQMLNTSLNSSGDQSVSKSYFLLSIQA